MLRFDLLRRGLPAEVRKIIHIRRIVHLADLLELVRVEIDADLRLQPRLLEDRVIADIGRKLRSALGCRASCRQQHGR